MLTYKRYEDKTRGRDFWPRSSPLCNCGGCCSFTFHDVDINCWEARKQGWVHFAARLTSDQREGGDSYDAASLLFSCYRLFERSVRRQRRPRAVSGTWNPLLFLFSFLMICTPILSFLFRAGGYNFDKLIPNKSLRRFS